MAKLVHYLDRSNVLGPFVWQQAEQSDNPLLTTVARGSSASANAEKNLGPCSM